MPLRVESIGSLQRLDALRGAWESLHREPAPGSPFLGPDWYLNCLDCFGQGKQCAVLAVWDGTRLVAVAPLWIQPARIRRIAVRELVFIRAPDTPFVEILAAAESAGAALERIADYLWDELGHAWDVARLGPIPQGSPTLAGLEAALGRARRRRATRPCLTLPYLDIEGDWPAYFQRRSAKFRKTARNISNRVGKLGEVEIRLHRTDEDGGLLEDLRHVARRSWKERSGVALSSDDQALRFFRRLTASAASDGSLLVWVLRAGGSAIATEYTLQHDKVVFALRSDFDNRYRDSSPGTFLQLRILEHLFDNGYRRYNTGPGINPYKLRTADRTMICDEIVVYNRTLKGAAAWALEEKLVPLARRLARRG